MGVSYQNANSKSQAINIAFGFFLGILVWSFFQSTPTTVMVGESSSSGSVKNVPNSFIEDDLFLGPDQGDEPPARRPGYVYETNTYQGMYDKTWTEGGYPRQSCWGCRFATDIVSKVKFHTLLDAGSGNGALVRMMREHGKSAWGIELSKAVVEKECPDLAQKGYIENGILTNLPYEDNSFDIVFSSDVLEHIHPDEAKTVISELVRVARRHLFMSISLKGHTKSTAENNNEAGRHTMLRPRRWWEKHFTAQGAVINRELLWAMQEKDSRFTRDQMRDCRMEGDEENGGTYEVCIVDNKWLVGRREQENVRRERCITVENMELEPWFFAYRKLR